LELKDG
jgi:hypothetical protein